MGFPFGLREQVARVTAVVAIDAAIVNFESSRRDRIEHATIMTDQKQRPLPAIAQEFLEPFDRLDVEMIRRLVENCEIRCRDEQPRERDPTRFTTTQGIDGAIRVRNSEMTYGGLGFVFSFPSALALERLPCLRLQGRQSSLIVGIARFGEFLGQLIEASLRRVPVGESLENDFANRSARREMRLLLQIIDGRLAPSCDLSAIRFFESGEYASEGALARSVIPDEAHLFASSDRQGDVFEKRSIDDDLA